jgi:hypothetical protein
MAKAGAMPGRKTTAKIVVERLIAHGIDTLFCLPGVQNDPFFDALYDETNRIRPIHTRHEQGAAYLALGAAMATGKPSAYCVVPGPGFLNTTAALSQAYGNNAPVLAIVGQVPLAYVNRDSGYLHDIPEFARPMKRRRSPTRRFGRWSRAGHARRPSSAPWTFGEKRRAFYCLIRLFLCPHRSPTMMLWKKRPRCSARPSAP